MRKLKRAALYIVGFLVIAVAGFLTFGPGIIEKGRNPVTTHTPFSISPEAQALHDTLIIGDWHIDPLLWNRDLSKRGGYGQTDVPRLIEGNMAVQMFTAVTKSPKGQNYEANTSDASDTITPLIIAQLWPIATWDSILERALYQSVKLHEIEAQDPDTLKIIRILADLDEILARRAAGEKILGALLGIEGAHPLEGDITNLDKLEAAGYRMVALQHFFDNALGGSLHGTSNEGLTDFGREVVAEVEKRGLILDVAHSSEQVVRDVLEMTDIPIVLSHTGIRSHCDVKRNISDDLMRGIAQTGGAIGIGYWRDVTCDDSPAGIAKTIIAAINVVGEDHVSLGSDYDGSVSVTFDASELAVITQALTDAGVSEAQIRKVMGENMMRVLRERLAARP